MSDSHLDRNGDNGFRIDDFLGGSLAVVDSTIDDNAAAGMYLNDGPGNADAEITVTRTSITGNGGTGLYLKDLGADVTIADSTMNNNANNGMYVTRSSGSVTITGSTMSDNTDNGLYLNRIAGDATITDSTMNGNGSQGIELSDVVGTSTVRDVNVDGGEEEGLVISRSGAALVERVHADGNALEAIRVTDSVGSTTITDSTLSGSTSEFGFATRDNVGDVRLERVTISGNAHGGLELLADTGQVVLVNSTITDNGVLVTDPVVSSTSERLEIVHSTMAGNGVTASTAAAIEVTDTVVTVDHSIVSGNNGMDVSSVSGTGSVSVTNSVVPDGSSLGASNPEADDPLLGPLADNGGTTGTMLPLEESPAIDAGSPALTAPPAPLTDQRGEDRVVDVIDIGAVEVQSADAVTSLSPARFVDTRSTGDTFDDRYEGEGKRAADSEYVVEIAGRGGVPADAKAVVINVTAVAVDARGFVTVHPCVSPRPLASSLNYTEGVNLANEIVAPLNADGELCLYTLRAAHLLVDVVGYVDADAPTVPVTPARYLDTRANGVTFDAESQRGGRTTAGGSVTLQVGDRGQVPAGVAAVIANVTAVGPTERGYVTVHPCAPSVPNASSLNFVAGVNRANELIAPVNADGELCLFTSSPVDLVVDVVGYIPQGSSFNPLVPRRFLDTRSTGETVDGLAQGAGRRAADSQVELQVAGRPGVPVDATAVVVNVTAAAPETRGFVTVHPCVDPRPNASSLNYVAGVNGANELIARLDADGKLCLYTNQSINLIVDVVGWLG